MAKEEIKNTKASAVTFLSPKDLGCKKQKDMSVGFAITVRSLLQGWRQGTVGCKDRSEVARTNKKPWKQKGTGRARAGTARSPLWRGGGVTFGPQARVKKLSVPRKVRAQVLHSLFYELSENKNIFVLDWALSDSTPSTKSALNAIKSASLQDKKVGVFLDRNDDLHVASVRNLSNAFIISFDDVNAYDLALVDAVVVLKKDIEQFKEMVSKWI